MPSQANGDCSGCCLLTISGFNRFGDLQRQEVPLLNWSSLSPLNLLPRLLDNREGV